MAPTRWRRFAIAGLLAAGGLLQGTDAVPEEKASVAENIKLPAPSRTGRVAVERALDARRSLREFGGGALDLRSLAQVLWAAQGVTGPEGQRTAPSAGALYPLEIHVVAGDVAGLPAGVYRYVPADHVLVRAASGDRREALAAAALDQDWMARAPAILVIAAIQERTARKYGARSERYVPFEAGCAAENAALQAVALGLGTVVVGAFRDDAVTAVAALRSGERPIAIMPVGRR